MKAREELHTGYLGNWSIFLMSIPMKTAALGRRKPKDAYDIYFIIKHYAGGVEALAYEFRHVCGKPIIQDMKKKLSEKFASVKHAGPRDVADFIDVADAEESEMIRRDAYEQVNALLERI